MLVLFNNRSRVDGWQKITQQTAGA